MIQTSAFRFKHFLKERQQLSLSGSEELLSVSEYYGVAPRSAVFSEERQETRAESLEGYRIVKKGDLVMNYMLAWKGAYGISSYDGIVSPAYSVFEVDQLIVDLRFLHHRTRSRDMQSTFKSVSKGIMESRLRLYPEILLSLPVELPPLDHQRRVSEYLDKRTSRIDTLIAKKTRFIELLKEKRQAVITTAVTKGLDDSVEMKDSGIEFLGLIPAHWIVAPVKHFLEGLDGLRVPLSSEERGKMQGPYPYYGASGIIDYVNRPIFKEDLILVSEDGANLVYRTYPISFVARGEYWVNNHAHVLRPKDACIEFWAERIQAISLIPFISGATQPKLTIENLMNIRISAPPSKSERDLIAGVVREASRKLDSLIDKTKRSIELLKEHRAALITAAVTGKIDVREAA